MRRPSAFAVAVAWTGAFAFVASLACFLYAYLVRFGLTVEAGPVASPLCIDVALFTIFALHHSLFARTGLKGWVRRTFSPELERSLYVWVASAIFIAVCWWWQPVPGVAYRLGVPWRWAGLAAQAAGVLLTFLGSKALDVLDLAGVRSVLRSEGGRPPAPVPLVTTGVYRIVRHPLYFGWVLLVFGAPDMTFTRLTFASVSTAYLALAIPWEERGLIETFGEDYRQYCRARRWRMIPGIY